MGIKIQIRIVYSILSASICAGSFALLGAQSDPPAKSDQAASQPQSVSGTKAMSPADVRLIDAWEKLLKDSKYATVKCHVERIGTKRDSSAKDSKPKTTYDKVVRAQAVMKRDANWLLVWEGNETEKREHDGPVLKVQCERGEVREDLWYPKLAQYRTRKYASPTEFGANDTEYEDGCMVGSLLATWLGPSSDSDLGISRMRAGEVLPDSVEVFGNKCRVFRFIFPEDEQPSLNDFFVGADGRLMRWQTIQTHTDGTTVTQITQTRTYDFTFFDEVPSGQERPAGTMPASPGR